MTREYQKVCETLIQVSRLVVAGKLDDARRYLQRTAFTFRKSDAMVWIDLNKLVGTQTTSSDERAYDNVVRGMSLSQSPRDNDTQLDLLAKEVPPIILDVEPIYNRWIHEQLSMVVNEYRKSNEIVRAGLPVSNKLIFSGPPGVGKTLAARWLANMMGLPIYTLNLAAVMSSFLGKTGNNIRRVFEFAKQEHCILLLDEFDAIAKNRNDETDIGELKRLVTVLLQEIDGFCQDSILIAATNHAETLDPAVWRRFDVKIDFSIPDNENIGHAIRRYFKEDFYAVEEYADILAIIFRGKAYSDIKTSVEQLRKDALISGSSIKTSVLRWLKYGQHVLGRNGRKELADVLVKKGFSQREASQMSGASRDTIRKMNHREVHND